MAPALAWIAELQLAGQDGEVVPTVAAVWASGTAEAQERLAHHVSTIGKRLVAVMTTVPATSYGSDDADHARIAALAFSVNPSNRVALLGLSVPNVAKAAGRSLDAALFDLVAEGLPVLAVLDGAKFADLPETLMRGGFVSRSLFLDRGDNDPDRMLTAPQLVWLDERQVIPAGRRPEQTAQALFSLVDDPSALVFWQSALGAEPLYKHLRGLNMVLYPLTHLPAPADETPPTDSHQPVFFRHADANVLAQVLPALDTQGLARFHGCAQKVLFQPNDDWNVGANPVLSKRPEAGDSPKRGMLRIEEANLAQIDALRRARRDRRITAYLKRVAPRQAQGIDTQKLQGAVKAYSEQAEAMGVQTESALGRWCYLQMMTKGNLLGSPDVQHFMTMPDPSISADQRVRLLLRESMKQAGVR